MRNLPGGDVGDSWPSPGPNINPDYLIGIECESPHVQRRHHYQYKICSIQLNAHFGPRTCPEGRRQNTDFQILQPPTQMGWISGEKFTGLERIVCPNFSFYIYLTTSSMTVDGSYSAMSNLSLKGITGIYAMGKINQLLEGIVSGADTNRTSYYLVSYIYPSLLHYPSMFLTNNLYVERLVNPIDFKYRKKHRVIRNDGRTSRCLQPKTISCRHSAMTIHGGSCTISTQRG